MHVCCRMLSLLTPRQSDSVGGPIGSLREANTVASYPNYDAAYLAKRLGALNPAALEENRYKSTGQFTEPEKELVYLQNATKGYEAEAEECLKKEFKDWLTGVHEDNYHQRKYDNNRPGAAMRRAAAAAAASSTSTQATPALPAVVAASIASVLGDVNPLATPSSAGSTVPYSLYSDSPSSAQSNPTPADRPSHLFRLRGLVSQCRLDRAGSVEWLVD